MKTLITLISLFMTLTSMAQTANYTVKEGKLHKGGTVTVKVIDTVNAFKVKTTYEIDKKAWVPVGSEYLKGETITNLPEQFKDERGYLELETRKEMKIEKAKLKFIKRTTVGKNKDAFVIEVLPDNNKSRTTITYHPDLPALGWASVVITFISDLPLLNGYQVIAELK